MGTALNLAILVGACVIGLIVSAVFNLSTDHGYILPRRLRFASVAKPDQLHAVFHWLLVLGLGGMIGFLANPGLVWVTAFGLIVALWSGYLDTVRFPFPPSPIYMLRIFVKSICVFTFALVGGLCAIWLHGAVA